MRTVIQRVSEASVTIDGSVHGAIGRGYMILVGIADSDDEAVINKMADKIARLRIFEDENGKMNRGLKDVDGEILSVSQFTLYADTAKGNRPSFIHAAKPEIAEALYHYVRDGLKAQGVKVKTGVFGADMQLRLVNDGPVTILLESKR